MTDVQQIADGAAQAFVLGPDDTLVVRVPADTTEADCAEVAAALRDRLGDRAVVICGAEQIGALRATTSPRNRMTEPGRNR